MNHLNAWAHKVKTKVGKMSKKQTDKKFEGDLREHRKLLPRIPAGGLSVSSEKELDRALSDHPHLLAAMPENRKRVIKASKKMPDSHQLQPGEQWAMVDSGAGTPAIHVKKHCPELLHLPREAKKKKRCIMANGDELVVVNELETMCELDGHEVPVTFSDLPVACPILGVRRIVRRGNMVCFQDEGGFILGKKLGRKIDFVEREGVYFVRMKIKGPGDPHLDFTWK